MSESAAQRAQLAADLGIALNMPVSKEWPTTLTPPCVYVTPPLTRDMYARGELFGEVFVNYDVVFLVPHDDPAESLRQLESLVETAIINTANWTFNGVDPPSPTTAVTEGGAEYLGSVMHVSRPIRLW